MCRPFLLHFTTLLKPVYKEVNHPAIVRTPDSPYTGKKYKVKDVGLYLLAALAVFFILDPYLWVDPFNCLAGSLLFHVNYTQGADVLTANYPWYQALNWITAMVPWHPMVFFFPTPDVVIFLLACVGIIPEFRKNRWEVVWIFSGFLILLVWPTKWPQYTLVLIPALCLAAAAGLEAPVKWAREFEETWHWGETVLPQPGRLFWITVVLFCSAIGIGKVVFEIQQAEVRAGWLQVSSEYSPLAFNRVNDIVVAKDGEIVLGTDNGISFWTSSSISPWGDRQVNLSTSNSGLADNAIFSLAIEAGKAAWFGHLKGASRLDLNTGEWTQFDFSDSGFNWGGTTDLLVDSEDRVWAATSGWGLSVWNGKEWTNYRVSNSGIPQNNVTRILEAPDGTIWMGCTYSAEPGGLIASFNGRD